MDFIEVVWRDAWADAVTAVTLKDVHESHKPELITTFGWLLFEDEDGISLANEVCADGSYRGRSYIPKVLITKRTVLKLTKPKKPKSIPLPVV